MHLMKYKIAFAAVISAANADRIKLANLIFPMVSLLHFIFHALYNATEIIYILHHRRNEKITPPS